LSADVGARRENLRTAGGNLLSVLGDQFCLVHQTDKRVGVVVVGGGRQRKEAVDRLAV